MCLTPSLSRIFTAAFMAVIFDMILLLPPGKAWALDLSFLPKESIPS
jgi:hypothetical protein